MRISLKLYIVQAADVAIEIFFHFSGIFIALPISVHISSTLCLYCLLGNLLGNFSQDNKYYF